MQRKVTIHLLSILHVCESSRCILHYVEMFQENISKSQLLKLHRVGCFDDGSSQQQVVFVSPPKNETKPQSTILYSFLLPTITTTLSLSHTHLLARNGHPRREVKRKRIPTRIPDEYQNSCKLRSYAQSHHGLRLDRIAIVEGFNARA